MCLTCPECASQVRASSATSGSASALPLPLTFDLEDELLGTRGSGVASDTRVKQASHCADERSSSVCGASVASTDHTPPPSFSGPSRRVAFIAIPPGTSDRFGIGFRVPSRDALPSAMRDVRHWRTPPLTRQNHSALRHTQAGRS